MTALPGYWLKRTTPEADARSALAFDRLFETTLALGANEAQPPIPFGPDQVQIAQLASLLPVQPLARLMVLPGDFPFLSQVRGHDDARLQEYATALQTGAPWPPDL